MKWRFLADVNFDSLLLVSKQSKTIRQPLITAFLYTLLTTDKKGVREVRGQIFTK